MTLEGVPDGQSSEKSENTNSKGKATFKGVSSQEGTYTLTVLDVQADGYVYDPEQNYETSDEVQVP